MERVTPAIVTVALETFSGVSAAPARAPVVAVDAKDDGLSHDELVRDLTARAENRRQWSGRT